ncbi:hypothetical protein FRB98_002543 [Tulasnella sp. 332]|nr:hypothetical protein FRB98_002543 [Tulasnella sp. 332]
MAAGIEDSDQGENSHEQMGWDVFSNVGWLVPERYFHIADPFIVSQICASRTLFTKPTYDIMDLYGPNVLSTDGDVWLRHRKISNPAFSETMIQLAWEQTFRVIYDMFDDWDQQGDKVMLNRTEEPMKTLTILILMGAAFGHVEDWTPETTHAAGHKMSLRDSVQTLLNYFIIYSALPAWVWGSAQTRMAMRVGGIGGRGWLGGLLQRTGVAYGELGRYLREMVDDRQIAGDTVGNLKRDKRDVFSSLVAALGSEQDNARLTLDDVFGNMFVFLLAGHETTAHSLTFVLGLMALEPEEQERLCTHINEVLGERNPTFEDHTRLDLVLAVFYETLRLFPSAPLIPKISVKDQYFMVNSALSQEDMANPAVKDRKDKQKRLFVPSGSHVQISVVGLHYNPRYWKDPYTFNPDRFLTSDWPKDAFLPFSSGSRACIGRKFAEVEAVLAITLIIRRFKVAVDSTRFQEVTGESKFDRRTRLMNATNCIDDTSRAALAITVDAQIAASPRKVVPLAAGHDIQRTRSENGGQSHMTMRPLITRRAYFCAVVVEGDSISGPLSQDVEDLVASLGTVTTSSIGDSIGIERSSSSPNMSDSGSILDIANGRKRALTSTSTFNDVLNEFVSTERSYVARLRTLKHAYADPLRKFARRKEEAILPAYEAKTLFGNIDAILPANEAFLADLELMMTPQGAQSVGGIGDVCLKHIRDRRAFDCYKQYYAKREEAQTIFEREMMKKSSTGFAGFIDRTKYSTESSNRVGLRELLMDPIQRIPRYTLMFRTMIKNMAPSDPQRFKLQEVDDLASKIALAETDEQTKRAAVMYCLERSIEGFPPNLISHGRKFIDCIDVEDVPLDIIGSGGVNSSVVDAATGPLHCTLFLFDDRLLIVKRPNGSASGRVLSGLEDMERAIKSGGLPTGVKKGVMGCKGVMDVTEVVATDVGSSDFHMYLETPPPDQYSDRWSNRPFRAYTVVHPPSPANLDPIRTQADKARFLENLWSVQAQYRTRDGKTDARVSVERELDSGKKSIVRTWFNVYKRTDWLKEPKKHKIVLHIDPMGSADPILFGVNGPPFVIARAQPMAGDLCRYTVTSSDPNDEGEGDIVHTAAIPSRIVQTIHQFGLFKFGTGRTSAPSTPSTGRSRASMFGLEAISRNLFNASSSIRGGDVFGMGTLSSSRRRTQSGISRSSTVTITTATTTTDNGNSLRFSQRSNSTTATSFASNSALEEEDQASKRPMSSLSVPRKLVKRNRSPGGDSGPESSSEAELQRHGSGSSAGYGSRRGRKSGRIHHPISLDVDGNEVEVEDELDDDWRIVADESEWDLSMRLELARKNSQSQGAGRINGTVRSTATVNQDSTILEDTVMEGTHSCSPSLLVMFQSSSVHSLEDAFPPSLSTEAQSGSTYLSEYDEGSPPNSLPFLHNSLTPTPSLAESSAKARSIHSVFSEYSERRPIGPRARTPTRSSPPNRSETLMVPNRPTTPTTIARLQTEVQLQRPSTPTRPTTPTRKVGYSLNHPLPPVPPLPLSEISATPTIAELERAVSPAPVHARRMMLESRVDATPLPSMIPTRTVGPTPGLAQASTNSSLAVQPLTIKKKNSILRQSSPTASKRKSVASPLERDTTTRRLSTQLMHDRQAAADAIAELSDEEMSASTETLTSNKRPRPALDESPVPSSSKSGHNMRELANMADATQTDLESSHRAVKRIRLEVDSLKASAAKHNATKSVTRDPLARVQSPPPGIPRSPQSRHIANKITEARMEEMRQMIQSRNGKAPVISSVVKENPVSVDGAEKAFAIVDEYSRKMADLVDDAEAHLKDTADSHDKLRNALRASEPEQDSGEVTRLQGEVARAKRQCDLVKKLLADASAENEIMYDAFNEELDGMFNDAGLPETEAWEVMTQDLRKTKEARNTLARENSALKRTVQELELQNAE